MWGCPPQQRSPFSWPGDEVDQLVDLASIGRKSPLDRRLRTRMATRPIQFTGMDERHTPKSEPLLLACGPCCRTLIVLSIGGMIGEGLA